MLGPADGVQNYFMVVMVLEEDWSIDNLYCVGHLPFSSIQCCNSYNFSTVDAATVVTTLSYTTTTTTTTATATAADATTIIATTSQ